MKRALLAVVLLSSVCGSRTGAESPVEIPDRGLKAAIENELWVTDPTPTDLLGLTHLNAIYRHIADLTGLEHAVHLRVLGLRDNQIGDLTPLAGLTQLVSLNLSMNQISDLSPLAGLHNLETLDVHDNPMISDISVVAEMPSLKTLIIRFNSVSDLSPLADANSLRHADLAGNRISNLAPLSELTSLIHLDVRYNPLSLDGCEVYLPRIEENNPGITLVQDQCEGFFWPRTVSISSTAGGSVAVPGEGEFVFPHGQVFWLTAVADPGFAFADWSGDLAGNANPTSLAIWGDRQVLARFVSVRSELHVDEDAPAGTYGDGSPAHPFGRIQDAVEVADDGASILVRPGTYRENLDLMGKRIHLTALDPENPHRGPCATIEGLGDGPVVRIPAGGESECSLMGFVITQGRAGAIHCTGSSPTITRCLIVGNRSDDPRGAALRFENSRSVLIHCTLADNDGGTDGAGVVLVNSGVTLLNSILWGNRPTEIRSRGVDDSLLRHCCVRGGWPGEGNLEGDPQFARRGSWADPANRKEALGPEDSSAVWVDGDYHLRSDAGRWDPAAGAWVRDGTGSPCIDAGDGDTPVGYEPEPNGNLVNLGAYGGTSEASRSPSMPPAQ